MIIGLTHIAVRVSDLERSLDFYVNKLSLKEQFRINGEDGAPRLVYVKVADRQFIELFPGANGPYAEPEGAGYVHICLQVDDIQKTYEELTGKGIVANGEPFIAIDNAWQFWTKDPDGNPIEFHQFIAESMQILNSDL